jgi:hypothetical protein
MIIFAFMDNELTLDIDLSLVERGINAAMYSVEMGADGGIAGILRTPPRYNTGRVIATLPEPNSNGFSEAE